MAGRVTVYIETSVISYLTSWLSGDLVVAANQKITQEWWSLHRDTYHLFTSEVAIGEASKGDPDAAAKRLQIIESLSLLSLQPEVYEFADELLSRGILPSSAVDDSFHIALATVYGMDYLLTWNCKHIANAAIQKKLALLSLDLGYELPTICTPQELMGG